ncbi:hypothetical protein C4587_01070 [Candidatus Parcubacteria bacterium]|nr:MAG: hypothetical protein C4587_01070 [Candidatus Parcubacteria bacterium]
MLLKLSKFFLYAAPFCIAIVMSSTFFPFIGGKYYFFRFAVEASLLFFVLWWAFEAAPGEAAQRFRGIISKPLFVAISLFVLVFLLATIFADNPHGAFWSNYERGDGGFQMIHYYVFFVLLLVHLRDWEGWRKLFSVSLIAAALMILYGFFAYLAILNPSLFCYEGSGSPPNRECVSFISPYQGQGEATPKTLWGLLTKERFHGSLGNPAYVAPYLMFSSFYLLYLWIRDGRTNGKLRTVSYAALLAVYALFFLFSQTRGAFLGIGAMVLAFFAYLAFSRPRWRVRTLGALAVLILIAGLLVANRKSDFVKNLPGGRLFDISFSDQTVQTRLWTWGSAWRGFLERPILGWGPENFSAVFDKHFDPRHYVPGKNTETWFDRAHSVIFDYLAETGLLGLLSYLGMFAVFYREFFRKAPESPEFQVRKPDPGYRATALQALVFSLPVGYLVQGLALFDVLPIYMNLFLFLAFAHYVFYEPTPAKS